MVRADDEHKNTTDHEEYTSIQKTPREKKMHWKGRKKNSNEPARLTTLPKCLMHWTTPVWIAAAGFLIALAFAVNWRGESHWPTAEAMKLCATIAGAGFAFSAWQQRSHDNVVNAKQAQATVEREDYWKRRDHIFQLLGSKNPSLRLGAVALLAELADSAAHYKFLKRNEMQQLQLHIVSTLCLQMRHEGLCLEAEGTRSEHQQIQTTILRLLFDRIANSRRPSSFANWSNQTISMTDTQFLTSFIMMQVTTSAIIILDRSTFHDEFAILESRLNHDLSINNTTFLSGLTIWKSRISVRQFPVSITETSYIQSTITHNDTKNTIKIELTNHARKLLLKDCDIYSSYCRCQPSCKCKRNNNNNCVCKIQNDCSCKQQCIRPQLDISFNPQSERPPQSEKHMPELTISKCRTGRIRLTLPANHFQIKVYNNTIQGQLEALFQQILK